MNATKAPRRGARRAVIGFVRRIPAYLRLLGGLITDRRVSSLDKALLGLAIAYVVSPLDFIPDFIPFLGEVDDIFLIGLALQRLIARAGRTVLLDHWDGDPDELADGVVTRMLRVAAFFLPGSVARKVGRLVSRSGHPVRD